MNLEEEPNKKMAASVFLLHPLIVENISRQFGIFLGRYWEGIGM
jgi:hypothetical protein